MKRDLSPGRSEAGRAVAELVKHSRYLQKNSGFVRELVGSMAIYSTGDGIGLDPFGARFIAGCWFTAASSANFRQPVRL